MPLGSENAKIFAREAIRWVFVLPLLLQIDWIDRTEGRDIRESHSSLLDFDLISAFHGLPFCTCSSLLKATLMRGGKISLKQSFFGNI